MVMMIVMAIVMSSCTGASPHPVSDDHDHDHDRHDDHDDNDDNDDPDDDRCGDSDE